MVWLIMEERTADGSQGATPAAADGTAPTRSSSPPTDRVIAIIGLLTAHPDEQFSLTDLVRRLGLSKATCYAVVQRLVESRYLVRTPAGYTLGPELVVVGRAAERSLPGARLAHPLVAPLAEEHDAECTIGVRDGSSILVVDWGAPRNHPATSRLGERIPFVPPFGAIQVAWADEDETADWFALAPRLTPQVRRDMERALASIRARGFDVHRESEASIRVRDSLSGLDVADLSGPQREALELLFSELSEVDYLPERLEPRHRYNVNTISAAAFDGDRRPAVVLSLLFSRPMTGDDILRAGGRLVAATDEITAALGGSRPS